MSTQVKSGLHIVRCALAVLAMVIGGTAWSQALSDPTRPPAAWIAAQSKKADRSQDAGAVPPGGAPGVPIAGIAESEAAPHLQSVLISPSGRFAIINGQLVSVGGTYKDAKLIELRPTEAVLLYEQGTQTLKLFPDVEKNPVKPVAVKAVQEPAKAKRRVTRRNVSTGKESR